MHKIKEMLLNELHEYEEKAKRINGGKISSQELDKIHKLTDTIKNIDKIEMLEEDGGYSEESNWMADGRMHGTSYERGSSYARGRGRNARRDSMGRYSRDDGMSYDDVEMSYERGGNRGGSNRGGYSRDDARDHLIGKAEELLRMAQTDEERKEIKKMIKSLEDDD